MFLSETKQDFIFLQKFEFHFGYNKLVTVDPCRTSGGLALFYNDVCKVNVLLKNNRLIDVELEIQGNNFT